MHRPIRATAAVIGLAAALAVLSPSVASATPGDDYFVVNTQIGTSSPIVEAGGAFADCSAVEDLGETATEFISPNRVMYIGDKRVLCDGGEVTIHYNATQNLASGKRTSGHWFVVESTLDGVTAGFGTVRGDNRRCTPAPGTDFCILDTFSGNTE